MSVIILCNGILPRGNSTLSPSFSPISACGFMANIWNILIKNFLFVVAHWNLVQEIWLSVCVHWCNPVSSLKEQSRWECFDVQDLVAFFCELMLAGDNSYHPYLWRIFEFVNLTFYYRIVLSEFFFKVLLNIKSEVDINITLLRKIISASTRMSHGLHLIVIHIPIFRSIRLSVYFNVLSVHVRSCKIGKYLCTGRKIHAICWNNCRALFHTPKCLLILVKLIVL